MSALLLAVAVRADQLIDLDQGWTASQQQAWYRASQGSRLLPASWLNALEQPTGTGMFLDADYIRSFRYLPGDNGALPIGFAIDNQNDNKLGVTKLRWRSGQGDQEDWVGFNCSACHTAEIHYQGSVLSVDGGPTSADFQGFLAALELALVNTRTDPSKFDRFAHRVLGTSDSPQNRAMLTKALDALNAHLGQLALADKTDVAYGFGRVDAVGYILNKTALTANPGNPSSNPPDAPVSYPQLWNISQQDRLQWDGLAANTPIVGIGGQTFDSGALGRNTGEVIGVFGDIHKSGWLVKTVPSSTRIDQMVSLEQQLMTLKPPRWPSALFGTPDPNLVKEGGRLYEQHCASCHTDLAHDDLVTRKIDRLSYFSDANPPGTDPWMACNAVVAAGKTGFLAGDSYQGVKLGNRGAVGTMLGALVTRALITDAPALAKAAANSYLGLQPPPEPDHPHQARHTAQPYLLAPTFGNPDADRLKQCDQIAHSPDPKVAATVAYKARPLTGIWATAPYLHNGSVPNLYELLLPPAQRSVSFNMGSREFDPKRVGFRTEPGGDNSFTFVAKDALGRVPHGNSNAGHDYGNSNFSEHQRLALVEYLKVIGDVPIPR